MAFRSLPKIKALQPDGHLDWDVPVKAQELWTPVKAASQTERTLNITDQIGDRGDGTGVTVGYVRGALARMGPGDITVNINSPGGDFFTGLAIYNLLREHDGTVNTNVLGVAASAASLIAMASDELRVAKAGFLMIHNAWAIAMGNRHDMTTTADLLGQFDNAMAGVYADRSGVDKAEVAALMDAETFLSGEEAVAQGFADALLESDEVEPDDNTTNASIRTVERTLAKAGLSRKQREEVFSVLKGDARDTVTIEATRDAGTKVDVALVQRLAKQIKDAVNATQT